MRRDNDAYYTLQAQTAIDALLRYVPVAGRIFEPCVGEGHLVLALSRHIEKTVAITNDIDKTVEAYYHEDARESHITNAIYDWVVTNPPFSQAFPILKNLLPGARQGVAFLLRLSFLEPTYERGPWLEAHPPDLIIVTPRFSFTGDGKTDSVTTAWFVWYTDKHADQFLKGIRVVPKSRPT